ncbi:hypothetical protein KPP23_062 [Pseudomonas phage KPP23]|nr:hypothetical protein KPP23_062 [Pseudomonas phage KPP23]
MMNKSENRITGGRFCKFHGGPLAGQQMRKDDAEFTDLHCSWLRIPGRDDGVYAVKTSYFCQDKYLDVFVYVWTGREDYDPDALVFPNSSPVMNESEKQAPGDLVYLFSPSTDNREDDQQTLAFRGGPYAEQQLSVLFPARHSRDILYVEGHEGMAYRRHPEGSNVFVWNYTRTGVAPALASILERGARLRAKAEENTQQPQEGHAMKKYRFYEDPDTRLLADQIERTAEELAGLIAGTLQHLDFHKQQATGSGTLNDPGDPEELRRLANAEPERWVSIARTHFQEGLMALRRAVEQPERF